jgi:hypothetical protein
MDKKFKVDREILLFAFRYSLGRMSYAPAVITDNIKLNINNISTEDIEVYIKEINEYENYGMEMDRQHWLNFKDYLQRELDRRNGLMNIKKFKQGDKVQIRTLIGEESPCVEIGDIGIVQYIDVKNQFPIRLKINGKDDYGFKEEELNYMNTR